MYIQWDSKVNVGFHSLFLPFGRILQKWTKSLANFRHFLKTAILQLVWLDWFLCHTPGIYHFKNKSCLIKLQLNEIMIICFSWRICFAYWKPNLLQVRKRWTDYLVSLYFYFYFIMLIVDSFLCIPTQIWI